MRLLICAGGTGGGVNPALAVLQSIGGKADSVLWVGGEGGMEADLVQRSGVAFTAIPAAGLHGVDLKVLPANLWRLLRGYVAASQTIKAFNPDVLFFTGGYVGVPVALAGRHIPILAYIPDIEPGLALKVISRFASCIAVTAEESRPYFSGSARLVVTGYPVRNDLKRLDAKEARRRLHLKPEMCTLLVFGGSKGARSINNALMAILPELLDHVQVIHISGRGEWAEVEAASRGLPGDLKDRYRLHPYLHEELGAAFSAADLAVCRSGASTLGELPFFGLPAILVPYPHAWRYQKVNAAHLVRNGAAVLLEDGLLSSRLLPGILDLVQNPARLSQMRVVMEGLATPGAAGQIAAEIFALAQERIN